MRPIDADALIEKCGGWYVDECTESGFIGTLENLLATEPTIQPQSTTGQLNDGAQSTARSTDLIDRQAAIDALQEEIDKGIPPFDDVIASIRCGVRLARNIIEDLPTAQPEPHEGYWILHESPDGGEQYECSECGVLWEFNDGTPEDNEAYFCPKCGAKMRGEQHETD